MSKNSFTIVFGDHELTIKPKNSLQREEQEIEIMRLERVQHRQMLSEIIYRLDQRRWSPAAQSVFQPIPASAAPATEPEPYAQRVLTPIPASPVPATEPATPYAQRLLEPTTPRAPCRQQPIGEPNSSIIN